MYIDTHTEQNMQITPQSNIVPYIQGGPKNQTAKNEYFFGPTCM